MIGSWFSLIAFCHSFSSSFFHGNYSQGKESDGASSASAAIRLSILSSYDFKPMNQGHLVV